MHRNPLYWLLPEMICLFLIGLPAVMMAQESVVQEAYLKSLYPAQSEHYGWGVACSGDTVAVAAHEEKGSSRGINGNQRDKSRPQSGAVFIYRRMGYSWVEEAYLKASNSDVKDKFGSSVSLDGDTLVVGAPYESSSAIGINGNADDNSSPGSGAAYIFVRQDGKWTQQAYLKASVPMRERRSAGNFFGVHVSISGDTVAVGRHVFIREAGQWKLQTVLTPTGEWANVNLGKIAEISGDTIILGGFQSNSTGPQRKVFDGATSPYVFVRKDGVWHQQARLSLPNPRWHNDMSLTLSGDTAVVGLIDSLLDENLKLLEKPKNQSIYFCALDQPFHGGAAYVFVRHGEVWTQQACLTGPLLPAGRQTDSFGQDVSLDGDTLMVAAPTARINPRTRLRDPEPVLQAAGAAHVFKRSSDAWYQQACITAPHVESMSYFGWRVAVSGRTMATGVQGENRDAKGVNGKTSEEEAAAASEKPASSRTMSNASKQSGNDDASANSGAAYIFKLPEQ